ncbi:MAG: DNA alkylation repair protein [Chlorobia bacterium]|nr:DNA alkylation repair protein [Fimbriimonadaceae bacterium]
MANALNQTSLDAYHREVIDALSAIGNPNLGKAIQKDRGSQLEYLGTRFPNLRKRVKQGFSFYSLPNEQVLAIWDSLWKSSPCGDVLFAALEFYIPIVRKQARPDLWPVVRQWSDRVDNWCHSDMLSALYSRILEGHFDEVYPQLQAWNEAQSEWLRRISLVSLVHYTGKNAVFLPPEKVLPLISNCLKDDRHYVQTAVGWVLREMGHVHRDEITAYLEANIELISAPAFTRAIERREPEEQSRLRALSSK